jgi:hypothetical protein
MVIVELKGVYSYVLADMCCNVPSRSTKPFCGLRTVLKGRRSNSNRFFFRVLRSQRK